MRRIDLEDNVSTWEAGYCVRFSACSAYTVLYLYCPSMLCANLNPWIWLG